jgi:hypothetical protein
MAIIRSYIIPGIAFLMAVLFPYATGAGKDAVAPDVQKSPLLFYHEPALLPEVDSFLKEFEFDEYVSAGETEFAEMSLLKDWVYRSVPYGLNWGDSELRDAASILRRARRGDSFLCTNQSAVFVQCAVSLGWTARNVFLRKSTGEEHAGNDIWSNQFRKWVYMDPTWNFHVERHAIPLGIQEIRREWMKNRGRDLVFVFGGGKKARRYRSRELPIVRNDSAVWKLVPLGREWLDYTFEVAVVGRNDFFTCCGGSPGRVWDTLYLVRDHLNRWDRKWPFLGAGQPVPAARLFHDLNRVDVKLPRRNVFHPGPVRVTLDGFGRNNYTPNFMEYLVRVNDGDWVPVANGIFTWQLRQGTNILLARIMNRYGVVGPVTVRIITVGSGHENAVTRTHHRNRRGVRAG